MRVVILDTPEQVSERAADLICELVRAHPDTTLGLATGGTPVATYQSLVRRHQQGLVDFQRVTTFNLDEYVGLPRDHEQSYHTFMHQHLFAPAGFDLDRCHLPDGEATDLAAACAEYERRIVEAGGIALQLLGVGTDGHIAFNEPGSSLASRTRIKALTRQTRQDNARFFDSIDEVPRLAITMGIGTILDARHLVLLATGAGKASVVASMVEGPLTALVPASALQLHPHATVILDAAAAASLTRRDYYLDVEAQQRALERD